MGPLGFITNTAGYVARKALTEAGKATLEVGKIAASAAKEGAVLTGKAALGVGGLTYKAGAQTVKGAWYMGESALAGMNSSNRFLNPIGNAVNLAGRFGSKMLKYEHETLDRNPITRELVVNSGGLKFTKLGAGIILGAGALAGTRDAVGTHLDNRVGPIDPHKVTAAPEIVKEDYSVIDNGGATGDLVFALHENRRG